MSKKAMKLAKAWFERNTYGDEAVDVYEALCEALAEQPAPAQQEPDSFDDDIEVIGHNEIRTRWRLEKGTKLYTSPPAQRNPLTVKEIAEFVGTHEYGPDQLKWFRLGEAAHGIKDNQ